MKRFLLASLILLLPLLMAVPAVAAPPVIDLSADVPSDIRVLYRNPDGSCVQCSLGMSGVAADSEAAKYLLWNTEHGRAVRGGSNVSRVRHYCQARGIKAWIVTGRSECRQWVDWAVETGRWSNIVWGGNHMLCCVGRRVSRTGAVEYAIIDNNSPTRVQWVSERHFERMLGGWLVVFQSPPAPGNPPVVPWWE